MFGEGNSKNQVPEVDWCLEHSVRWGTVSGGQAGNRAQLTYNSASHCKELSFAQNEMGSHCRFRAEENLWWKMEWIFEFGVSAGTSRLERNN